MQVLPKGVTLTSMLIPEESINYSSSSSRCIVIEAGRTERHYWFDVWRYRELLQMLAMRDILVRYKQTTMGVAWALLRPMLTVLAFTLVFSRLAQLPSEGIPYPILVMAGVLPWLFFSSALTDAGNSLIENSNMISKVYFPRVLIPASSIVVSLVDFLISFFLLVVLMLWYGYFPGWGIFALPFYIGLVVILAIGGGLVVSALNVKYRDFRYVIPFFVQFGLYISPVGFSSSIVPDKWYLLYSLNPMVGVIDGVRWSISSSTLPLPLWSTLISAVFAALLLLVGLFFFRRTERQLADII